MITVVENIFSKHTKHVKYHKVIISTLNLIMLWLSFKRLLNPTYDVFSFQCKKKTTSFSAELGNSSSFSQNLLGNFFYSQTPIPQVLQGSVVRTDNLEEFVYELHQLPILFVVTHKTPQSNK